MTKLPDAQGEINKNQNYMRNMLHDFFAGDTNYIKKVPTGFNDLDSMLGGGITQGSLVMLGASPSLGKSTFAFQLAENISSSEENVIIFSMEMLKHDILSKSISRNLYSINKKLQLSTEELSNKKIIDGLVKEERATLNLALQEAEEKCKNIYLYDCTDGYLTIEKIIEIVENHIRETGKIPFVIIDYLQLIPILESKFFGDKKNIDLILEKIKKTALQKKVTFFIISSFNRESYTLPVTLASFKESGNIEYDSDILVAMQYKGIGERNFDLKYAREKEPREIEMILLKQRNGKIGNLYLKFDPKNNYFYEGTADKKLDVKNTQIIHGL